MKTLAMYFAPLLVLVACGVDSPEAAGRVPSRDVTIESPSSNASSTGATSKATAEPGAHGEKNTQGASLLEVCSTSSPGVCSGATIGQICHLSPTLWCLPNQELPDGSIFCKCQSQSTI